MITKLYLIFFLNFNINNKNLLNNNMILNKYKKYKNINGKENKYKLLTIFLNLYSFFLLKKKEIFY